MDVTIYHNGYHADLNETFFVGKVDDATASLVKIAYDSLMAAMAACKSNVPGRHLVPFLPVRQLHFLHPWLVDTYHPPHPIYAVACPSTEAAVARQV